jgi:hypothetical protein
MGSDLRFALLTLNEYSKYLITDTLMTATLLESPKINVANCKATRLLKYTLDRLFNHTPVTPISQ